MSLFGEKCTCCGKKISSLSKFQKISDGTICDICSQMCSPDLDSIELKTKEEIKLHINFRKRNYRQYKEFKPTNNISNIFLIDNVNKLFCMPKNRDDMNPDLFKFSELTKFELVEDGAVSSGGGLGTSIAGGLLFGGVGAIVGSNIASKKNYVNDMHIHLILKHPWVKSVTIGIITNNTAKGSIVYKTKKAEAEKIVSFLNEIVENNSTVEFAPIASAADEIKKYKELLDLGAISNEEFEAKKKQLLNI